MNPSDWAKLKEWFGDIIDAPQRETEVMDLAENDSPALATELRALLRQHAAPRIDTASLKLDLPRAIEAHAPNVAEGASIGPYSIVRELGRGGSGVVFLATRTDDEFQRPVALKALRYVAWDRRTQELLTEERGVLSQLQHPNIAALLDWSTAAEEAPWLAMEYVEGQPIDEYCHSRGLGVPATLDVFEQVCEAVQYAHRRLVVHRDLKPGNILVCADGTPKLLDFGLAKLLDFGISKRLEDATVTSAADRRFTPAYASPEQIKGEPITAATDVYALGLILYELLAGTAPYATGSVESLMRRTQDRPVTPPSTRAVLPNIRARAIEADLDRIVVHALERDPEHRYPSVERLLADIRAYRGGFPIVARPPSRIYRAERFIKRNVLAASLASLALVAVIGGAAIALAEARNARRAQAVAERRFDDVRNLAHWVIFDAHDAIRRVPGTVAVRRDLLAKAVEYLDRLNTEHSADDNLLKEIAQAYVRVGYSQGGLAGTNLGNTPASMKAYRAALQILDGLWVRHPDDDWIGAVRFAAAYNLSMMMSDARASESFVRPYVADADRWVARREGAPPLQAAGLVHIALGRALRRMGLLDSALVQFELSRQSNVRAIPLTNTDNKPRPMFGVVVDRSQNYFDTGLAMFARTETLLEMGRAPAAVVSAEEARAEFARARDVGLGGPSDRRMFARVHGLLAQALLETHDPSRFPRARANADSEMSAALENVADGNATSQRDLAEAHRHMGVVLYAQEDVVHGRAHLRESVAMLERLVAMDPAFFLNRELLVAASRDLAQREKPAQP